MPDKQHSPEFRFDVATALSQGRRDYQEDALAADFPHGGRLGFAVLSDGMGGHAAGDVASKIVVTEVFSELKFQSGDPANFATNISDILRDAAMGANECVRAHTKERPETAGMGATLVAPVIFGNHLHWISVGDSPMFLFRDGHLQQLNEDHSLAPQIDLMATAGLIAADIARNHPDRNCLTSVLIGGDIERIDCPPEPFLLKGGDIVVVSSDGLQSLENDQIAAVLGRYRKSPSTEIADALMERLAERNDPAQDNASFCVIKVVDVTGLVHRRSPSRILHRASADIVPISSASTFSPERRSGEAAGNAEA